MLPRIIARGGISLILCLSFCAWTPAKEQQKAAATAPTKPRLGQAGSQQELDAYNKMHNEVDPAEKRGLIDKFAGDYPESGLLAYVYQDGVYLGRQSNNIEMMAEYGEKSLELWPENYTLLTELGSVYVQRHGVEQAETKARRALELIALADKPAHMTELQWAEGRKMLMASNHTTLGYVNLRRAQAGQEGTARRSDAEDAISAFQHALEYEPTNDFALYGLGFAYAILNDYPDAESNLAKAVAVNGIIVASARNLLEEIYKSQHNQSLNGLEQVIAKAKAELGLS
jgi:tetratricopeptide (TPR) repeat protein